MANNDKLSQTVIEGTGKKATRRVIKCGEKLADVRYERMRLTEEEGPLETALLDVMEKDGVEEFTLENGIKVTTKTIEAKKKAVLKKPQDKEE